MSVHKNKSTGRRRDAARFRVAAPFGLAVVVLATGLGGCSSVPDALNPVEWYRGVSDAIAGDDAPPAADAASAEASAPADAAFPSVQEVPAKPASTTAEERAQVAEGLVADRDRARYSSEVIQRQGDAAGGLSPQAGADEPPAPRAAPTPEVTPAPAASPAASPMASPAAATEAPMPQVRQVEAQRRAPVTVEERYRELLSQRRPLPEGQVAQSPRSVPPAMETMPGGTMMISSAGVQTGYVSGAAQMMPMPGMVPVSGITPRTVANGQARDLAEFDPARVSQSHKVATIHFVSGSSNLSANDRDILRQVAALARQHGGSLRVVGHASSRTRDMDPVEHKLVNLRVSIERADRIAAELGRMGVTAAALFVGAVADSEPLYYEVMPSGEAGNRRAEIYIDY